MGVAHSTCRRPPRKRFQLELRTFEDRCWGFTRPSGPRLAAIAHVGPDLVRVCLVGLALLAGGLAASYATDGFVSEAIEHAGCVAACVNDGGPTVPPTLNWRGAACHCHSACDDDPWWP